MLVSKLGKSAILLLISGLTCRLLESLAEAFKGSDESKSINADIFSYEDCNFTAQQNFIRYCWFKQYLLANGCYGFHNG